jgi:peptide deformylase
MPAPSSIPPLHLRPAELAVVHYPDHVLRARALPVPAVTDEVKAVAARMVELMFQEEGIGLAAPQVGLGWRMFVAHVPPTDGRRADPPEGAPAGWLPDATREPTVYINPVLSAFEGSPEPFKEGCLSLPEIRGEVFRPPTVTIRATALDGKPFECRATGLLARCWQHEVDHLDGVLIIDKMTQMSRLAVRGKVRALERDGGGR